MQVKPLKFETNRTKLRSTKWQLKFIKKFEKFDFCGFPQQTSLISFIGLDGNKWVSF